MRHLSILIAVLLVFTISFVGAEITGNTITWGGETGVGFKLSSTNPQCVLVDSNPAWQVYSESTKVTTASGSDCYRSNGFPSTTCCQIGQVCNLTSYKCYSPSTPVNYCRDYTSLGKTACQNANSGVGELSVEEYKQDSNFCNYGSYNDSTGCTLVRTSCKCMWFPSTGRCDFNYTEVNSCVEGGTITSIPGNCVISLGNVIDNCNSTGELKYDAIATWSGDLTDTQGNCINKTVVASCGSLLKLPFFSVFNVIIALVIIAVLYFIAKRKFIK